jgi:hypothetical protein
MLVVMMVGEIDLQLVAEIVVYVVGSIVVVGIVAEIVM